MNQDHPRFPEPARQASAVAAAGRVIDANLNRADEATRVIEDTLRFVVEDRGLHQRCKRIRHEIGDLTARLAGFRLITTRNAAADTGHHSNVASEYSRDGWPQIIKANFSRLRQSLRTIEEYAKLVDPDLARQAEQIRYSGYDLERNCATLLNARQRLRGVALCVLVDGCDSADEFAACVGDLVHGGAGMLQLRDKQLSDRTLWERAGQLVEILRPTDVLAVINDRPDLAVAVGADGVHIGQDDLPLAATRKLCGGQMLVGVSTHHVDQVIRAVNEGADYLGVGPVFPSSTKSFETFPGTELLQQVAGQTALPAFAIGGITRDNLDQVVKSGFCRVAVSAAVRDSDLPIAAATRQLANYPGLTGGGDCRESSV